MKGPEKRVPVTSWPAPRLRVEERPPIRRVATNILNMQLRTANKSGPPALRLGEVVRTPHRKNLPCYKSFTNASDQAFVNAVMNLRVP